MRPGERAARAAGERTGVSRREAVDVLGVGFGPSNLALAIAVEERNEHAQAGDRPISARFVERQPCFGWHRGMLLDDATMQVSFLKDLVTLRNPASDYSFVSYLHERGRLSDFINHKILFPSRLEYHDYLEWAAGRLGHLVTYGEHVEDVHPVIEGGRVVAFDVVSARAGVRVARRARNVAVATGLAPHVPEGVTLGDRVWHNLDLVRRVAEVPGEPAPRRFVVVGAGQSAAEAVEHLHRTFPSAEVCSVFARFGYSPADDTPYANRIFDPDAVDTYYDADEPVKRMLFDYHRNTNYSVVDPDLINELYRREYQEKVTGRRRLRMMNASRVTEVDAGDDAVDVEVEFLPTGERQLLRADAVIYATGYEPTDALGLLGQAGRLVRRRFDGAPEVGRDYRLALTVPSDAAIYLQGGTEHAHGITSTLLSNIAVRSGEIAESVAASAFLAGTGHPTPGDVVAAAG
jgi:L-ornithine N5-monooxygenase